MNFTGFSPDTFVYLKDVRDNDSKIWYDAHKDEQRRLIKEPFYALAEDLTPTIRRIDPLLITEPSKCLSRIRRDTRFTKDKHLYRSSAWLTFKRPSEYMTEQPAFFFEISEEGVRWGMGTYSGVASFAAKLRNAINAEPDVFAEAISPFEKNGLRIFGNTYKRFPAGISERAEALGLKELYGMKDFYIATPFLPREKVYTSDVVNAVQTAFSDMAPFYSKIIQVGLTPQGNTDELKAILKDFEW